MLIHQVEQFCLLIFSIRSFLFQLRKMFAKNSKMANGLIHPIVRAIFYAVVLEHSGENKNVKFAILVCISILISNVYPFILSIHISGAYFDPNEKTCKWVGMDKVDVQEKLLFQIVSFELFRLIAKNLSKVMIIPLLV